MQGIYKLLMETMDYFNLLPSNMRALIAGGIAGRYVWARFSAVNYQIVLYLLSRVILKAFKGLQGFVSMQIFSGVSLSCHCMLGCGDAFI
mmetsp:Transcript_4244/g.6465  ORF Transcript_4244/g.6465 Transcript_4244/m.6465 type:complete len:90 (+) Transcript_4244:173-442(+)